MAHYLLKTACTNCKLEFNIQPDKIIVGETYLRDKENPLYMNNILKFNNNIIECTVIPNDGYKFAYWRDVDVRRFDKSIQPTIRIDAKRTLELVKERLLIPTENDEIKYTYRDTLAIDAICVPNKIDVNFTKKNWLK